MMLINNINKGEYTLNLLILNYLEFINIELLKRLNYVIRILILIVM